MTHRFDLNRRVRQSTAQNVLLKNPPLFLRILVLGKLGKHLRS
jgi:hypothetical protein